MSRAQCGQRERAGNQRGWILLLRKSRLLIQTSKISRQSIAQRKSISAYQRQISCNTPGLRRQSGRHFDGNVKPHISARLGHGGTPEI